MYKKIKFAILKYYKESIFKALLGTTLFVILYLLSNIELVRDKFEDVAFDITNSFYFSNSKKELDIPKIKIFSVNEQYLRSENLFNDKNETNYGYLFPRDKIANFIKKIDSHTKNIGFNPKVLFIDYDMTYTSTVYNNKLSKEDKYLIKVLKEPRSYKIIIPKTKHINFIEQCKDKDIQNLILKGKIIFASTGLLKSSDDVNRRYYPYKRFNDKIYLNSSIILYNMINNTNINKNKNDFTQQDIVKNRILFKSYMEINKNTNYSEYQSYWNNITKYSANYPLNKIVNEHLGNSIIFFGGSYKNYDNFKNNSLLGNTSLYGIDIHANSLMSLLWLNGSLEKVNIFISILLVFIILFIVDLTIEIVFELCKWQQYRKWEFTVSLIVSAIIMGWLSIYILETYKLWFNWIAPFILFEVIELLEVLKIFSIWGKIKQYIGEKNESNI